MKKELLFIPILIVFSLIFLSSVYALSFFDFFRIFRDLISHSSITGQVTTPVIDGGGGGGNTWIFLASSDHVDAAHYLCGKIYLSQPSDVKIKGVFTKVNDYYLRHFMASVDCPGIKNTYSYNKNCSSEKCWVNGTANYDSPFVYEKKYAIYVKEAGSNYIKLEIRDMRGSLIETSTLVGSAPFSTETSLTKPILKIEVLSVAFSEDGTVVAAQLRVSPKEGKSCYMGVGTSGTYYYTFKNLPQGSHEICVWPSCPDYYYGEDRKWKASLYYQITSSSGSNCIHKTPLLTVTPKNQTVQAGEEFECSILVTNIDEGECEPLVFKVKRTIVYEYEGDRESSVYFYPNFTLSQGEKKILDCSGSAPIIWSTNNTILPAKLTISVEGTYYYDSKSGYTRDYAYVYVLPPGPVCGNGICEEGEDFSNCPEDCLAPNQTTCGNGICEPEETAMKGYGQITSCPQDCGYEIDPYDADVDTCINSKGIEYSTTGPKSASWFLWGNCAKEKYYQVEKGKILRFHVYTDSCPGCVCYFPDFDVYEYQDGKWVLKKSYDLPNIKGMHQNEFYTPNSNKIKIVAKNCFYLDVFSLTKPPPINITNVTSKTDKLITLSWVPRAEILNNTNVVMFTLPFISNVGTGVIKPRNDIKFYVKEELLTNEYIEYDKEVLYPGNSTTAKFYCLIKEDSPEIVKGKITTEDISLDFLIYSPGICERFLKLSEVNTTTTPTVQPQTYEINFHPGWNLFSIPVKKTIKAKDFLANCGVISKIWHYTYGVGYVSVDELKPGYGYWVKVNSNCKASISGEPVTIEDFSRLSPGWNQIGAPTQAINFYKIIGDCILRSGPWKYNTQARKWEKTQVLNPGEGYFVKVTSSCNLGEEIPPLPPEEWGIAGKATEM